MVRFGRLGRDGKTRHVKAWQIRMERSERSDAVGSALADKVPLDTVGRELMR